MRRRRTGIVKFRVSFLVALVMVYVIDSVGGGSLRRVKRVSSLGYCHSPLPYDRRGKRLLN